MKDHDGQTALIRAIRHGHDDLALWLINKGADVKVKDRFGKTALYYAKTFRWSNIIKSLKKAGAKE